MDELVDWIAVAHLRFLRAIERLPEPQLLEPRLPGGWSVKDVLAHLAWWDRWLLYTLQVDGSDPSRPAPPLIDQIPTHSGWADLMNARVYDLNRERGLAEVQAEFEDARLRVAQAMQCLSAEDVFGTGGRSAAIGQPVGPLVFGIYEHYDEHAHEIEQLFSSY
jgi:hypothetical protein